MKVGILGTGTVGQTFAEKFISLGHDVMMGTRSVADIMARQAADGSGVFPFREWHSKNEKVQIRTFEETAAFGDILINALQGAIAIPVFSSCATSSFEHKIIIDIANPLDFSKGFPPSLIEGLNNTSSLGEALQESLPAAKVVKTLNTMYCGIMVNPAMVNNGNHTNYICGNDTAAKEKVKSILNSFGWKNENILDLGDITNARGTESTLLIWTRVYGATKTGAFNFQIVK